MICINNVNKNDMQYHKRKQIYTFHKQKRVSIELNSRIKHAHSDTKTKRTAAYKWYAIKQANQKKHCHKNGIAGKKAEVSKMQ